MGAKIKICGLSNIETLDVAIKHGADMIGLVFFPASPRHLNFDLAEKLANRARQKTKIVALVVDANDELIEKIVKKVSPDYFQAHGSETPERILEIKQLSKTPVIKAIKVRVYGDIENSKTYENSADMLLFDAKAPDNNPNALPGGNGISFDWTLLKPSLVSGEFMLSGGLDSKNVCAAILATKPNIVDVSSGVESAPGIKDVGAIKKFIEAARAAS